MKARGVSCGLITFVVVAAMLDVSASGQDVVVITGRVLNSDGEGLQPLSPGTLVIDAVRAGDPVARTASFTKDGRYFIRVPDDQSVWTIRYDGTDRHPGIIENVSGVAEKPGGVVNVIDKILFPLSGPGGYERNLSQLVDYEKLWYVGRAAGEPVAMLRQKYGPGLLRLPVLGGRRDYDQGALDDLLGNSSAAMRKRSLFLKKKSEVFRLFQIILPESSALVATEYRDCPLCRE